MVLNEQSEFSKQCLTDALFLLLEHKSFQKITIKELTEKAGVSRLTFYRNFDTKEDILKRYYRIHFSQYMEELDEKGISSIKGALAVCFDYWKNAENHIQLILNNHLEYFLYEPFESFLSVLLQKYHIGAHLKENQIHFLIGGLYFSMIHWVSDDSNLSSEDMAASILDILAVQV